MNLIDFFNESYELGLMLYLVVLFFMYDKFYAHVCVYNPMGA